MGGNLAVALGGTLFTIVVARSLSPVNFGIFSAIFALATLFSSLADLGISSALINFLPKVKGDRSTIISVTFWMQLVVALILALLSLGFLPIRQDTLPGAQSLHIVYLSLLIVPLVFESFALAILKAEKRFFFVSLIMTLDSWMKLILTYLLLRFNLLDISSVLLASIAASSLATAFAISKELKHVRPIFPRAQVSKIVHFAKWIALVRVFGVGISRIDIILLNAIGSSFQAGIYAASSRITLLYALLVSSLGSVVAPRFSAFTTKQQVKQYVYKLLLLTSFFALGMVALLEFAPLIIRIVYGEAYLSTIPIFRYLTYAMIPFLYATVTTNPIIFYFNKPNFIAFTTVIQIAIIVTLDLALIPSFGAIAPAISLAVSNSVVLLLTGWRLIKLLN